MIIDKQTMAQLSPLWEDRLERQGRIMDVTFIEDDDWYQDAAVIDFIQYSRGLWHVSLVFVHPKDTCRFIVRGIRSCPTQARAQFDANYIRRTASKDPRGTVRVSLDQFSCSPN
ncbi:MAG: hypothetical protein AAGA85_14445 [Bacteroidota bacterium]